MYVQVLSALYPSICSVSCYCGGYSEKNTTHTSTTLLSRRQSLEGICALIEVPIIIQNYLHCVRLKQLVPPFQHVSLLSLRNSWTDTHVQPHSNPRLTCASKIKCALALWGCSWVTTTTGFCLVVVTWCISFPVLTEFVSWQMFSFSLPLNFFSLCKSTSNEYYISSYSLQWCIKPATITMLAEKTLSKL